MDKFLTFQGLQPIWLGDFNFMQKAVGDAFANVTKAISGHDSIIISGCDVSFDSQRRIYSWTDGIISLDGEILPIRSGSINLQLTSSMAVYFDIMTSFPSEGERIFKDGTTHDCYEVREATLTVSQTKWIYSADFPRFVAGEKKIASFVSDVDGIEMSAGLIRRNDSYYLVGAFKTTTDVSAILVDNVTMKVGQPDRSSILAGGMFEGKTYYALALSSAIELGTGTGENSHVVPLMVSIGAATDGISLKMQIAPDLPELGVILPSGIQSTFEIRLNTI